MTKASTIRDWEREPERVAALIAEDQRDRHEQQIAMLDVEGERRFVRPTALVAERRRIAANGHSEAECIDTIGKLWSWGLLDGGRYAADLLRDAGRRYAAAYWYRYGQVCPSIAAYSDMSRGSGGPRKTYIADEAIDLLIEERFRARDRALIDSQAKRDVDLVCVDGAGDNDPGWLVDLMTGYLAETRALRVEILSLDMALANDMPPKERATAERRHAVANRNLTNKIKMLKVERLPHVLIARIRDGLCALADLDRSEGFHRPRRGRPKKQDSDG